MKFQKKLAKRAEKREAKKIEKKPVKNNQPFLSSRDIDGNSALHNAILHDNLELVKSLIDSKKADLNIKNHLKDTPLGLALLLQKLPAAQLLIEGGADINIQDDDSYAPLHDAAGHGNLELVQLLIKGGANIHALDCDQQTPLFHAVISTNFDVVKALIEAGSEINIKNYLKSIEILPSSP